MSQHQVRCFAAGSRQAPDPHDQFLEKEHFYRKHTARDPSSLFRCISEQLFDTQKYFKGIREQCVNFMRRNRHLFVDQISLDYDDYLANLAKLRTSATLLELKAVAYCYRRNVTLFEPYSLGQPFVYERDFESEFQIFVTPDNHFDSVYHTDYIEDAAFCQSIIYEILYKQVFKLPDVEYAVERMLHDPRGETIQFVTEQTQGKICNNNEHGKKITEEGNRSKGTFVTKAITDDGQEFIFDDSESTNCILEDYRLCHFHNKNFDKIIITLQEQHNKSSPTKTVRNGQNASQSPALKHDQYNRNKFVESLLMDKNVSCVSQLLYEGITPFPYKVAKALDPYIYRNIEFDVWNEMRKENRLRFIRRYLFVGDKCFVRLNNHNDMDGNENSIYVGHIQYIDRSTGMYHVYVEELGQIVVVPLNFLQTYNMYDNRYSSNWVKHRSTCKGNFQTRFRTRRLSDSDEKGVRKSVKGYLRENRTDEEKPTIVTHNYYEEELHLKDMMVDPMFIDQSKILYHPCIDQYTKYFQPPLGYPNEFVAMPAFVKPSTLSSKDDKESGEKKDEDDLAKAEVKLALLEDEGLSKMNEDYVLNTTYCDVYNPYSPQYYNPMLYSGYGGDAGSASACYPFIRNGTYYYNYVYNPYGSYMMPTTNSQNLLLNPYCPGSGQVIPVQNVIKRKDLMQSPDGPINLCLGPSVHPKGTDLPVNDPISMRFFYNIGIECFSYLSGVHGQQAALQILQGNAAGNTASSLLETAPCATPMLPTDIGNDMKPCRGVVLEHGATGNSDLNLNATRNSTPSSMSQAEIVGNVKNYQTHFPNRRTSYNTRTYTRTNTGQTNYRGGKGGGDKNNGRGGNYYNNSYNQNYNQKRGGGSFVGYTRNNNFNSINNAGSGVVIKKEPKDSSPVGSPYNSHVNFGQSNDGNSKSTNSMESSVVPTEQFYYGQHEGTVPSLAGNSPQVPSSFNYQQPIQQTQNQTVPVYNQQYYYTTYYPVDVAQNSTPGQIQPMGQYLGNPPENGVFPNYSAHYQQPGATTFSHEYGNSNVSQTPTGTLNTTPATTWTGEQSQVIANNGWTPTTAARSAPSSGIGSADSSPPYGITTYLTPNPPNFNNFTFPPPAQPHYWYGQAPTAPQLTPTTIPNASPNQGRLDSFPK